MTWKGTAAEVRVGMGIAGDAREKKIEEGEEVSKTKPNLSPSLFESSQKAHKRYVRAASITIYLCNPSVSQLCL